MKTRNLVAKYAKRAGCQSRVYRDRKRDQKTGRVKYPHQKYQ